ncbi:MAG: tetratricopeptide repeat protein [Vicinamibacterales bacterium]|nr:tetratricopeptide repeat protein [Vicinamibacterales bacterium]
MRLPFRVVVILFALMLAVGTASTVLAQGRVSGTVKDDGGQPIKGATVAAKNPQAVPSDFTTTTDDKGRWSFIGMQAGQWTFTASADGYLPVDTRTPIAYLRANPPIEFKLAKATPGMVAGGAAKELQGELKAADALMANRQWDEAIAAYKAILVKAPALSLLNLQVAQAYRAKKDFDNAIATYEDVLKTEPSLERVYVELGNVYMQKGDFDKAAATLEKAASTLSAGREVFYNLGEVYFSKGQMDEATKHFQTAAERDATWPKPVFKLGLVALNKGDKAGAITMMEKVLALDPNSPEAAQAKTMIEQLKK